MNEPRILWGLEKCFLESEGGIMLVADLERRFEELDLYFVDIQGLLKSMGFGCSNDCVFLKHTVKKERFITTKIDDGHSAEALDIHLEVK